MRPSAHGRDERDLVAGRDDNIPLRELLVDGGADRFAVGVQSGMQLLECVIHIVDGRARSYLDRLGVCAGLFAQPGEEPCVHGDRDRHQPSLVNTKTWTSFPESSARSTVARVPFEAPSQNATSTSHASTSRWLRAADLLASASSSNDAGMTWTGMPLARAAFVAAASTPLALPVMIEARGGSDFTYSVTRSGSEKRLLPTIANFSV